MVRFNMRSLAVMAFAVFATASPLVNNAGGSVAPVNAAPVAPVAQAPINVVPNNFAAPAERKEMPAMYMPEHMPGGANAAQKMPFDMRQMQRMVPCSEDDCLKDMSPEEQESFKRQCQQLLESQQKATGVNGQSRVAKGGVELKFFEMVLPGPAGNKRVAQAPGTAAVGNRPAGKKLCCCCCCPCCCHCCCCPCCCCCCKCCHCCCCCPCCCCCH